MEKRRVWILRPISWILTAVMVIGLQYIAELLSRLGEIAINWVGGMSTIMTVVLAIALGGPFISAFYYSAILLPAFLVSISDSVYPSNHAFRYYFIGIYEIIGCAILIIAAILGFVKGGTMFWFYARYAWLILACIIMMVSGNTSAKERHK